MLLHVIRTSRFDLKYIYSTTIYYKYMVKKKISGLTPGEGGRRVRHPRNGAGTLVPQVVVGEGGRRESTRSISQVVGAEGVHHLRNRAKMLKVAGAGAEGSPPTKLSRGARFRRW